MPVFLVLSAPQMFGFMEGHCSRLRRMGYLPFVVAAQSEDLDRKAAAEGAIRLCADIRRDISPWSDLCSLVRLSWLFFRHRPVAVLFSGPKAIFLGGIAAFICGVPRRVVVYHGMRQELYKGLRRGALDLCDHVSFALADVVLVVSSSLKDKVVSAGLCSPGKIKLTGPGTANGIDAVRFNPADHFSFPEPDYLERLGNGPTIGFIGRITEDKGIEALLAAFDIVRSKIPNVRLMIVGQEEVKTLRLKEELLRRRSDPAVIFVGSVEDVRGCLAEIDVMAFPSMREGFPIAPMEAAAFGIPTVGFESTGVIDAIIHGVTGMIAPQGDVSCMAKFLFGYLDSPSLRQKHGMAARQRIVDYFHPDKVWQAYESALAVD